MRQMRNRSVFAFVGLLIVGMLVAACGGDEPTPTPTSPAPTPTAAEPTAAAPEATPTAAAPTATPTPEKTAFELQWEQLVADAKAEGQVNILMGGAARRLYLPVLDLFSKKYDVKLNVLGGSTDDLTNRILAEREAGRFTQDVAMGGGALEARWMPAGALDPITPLFILPEVVDTSLWASEQHWYRDLANQFIFLYSGNVGVVQGGIWYNTEIVTQEELDSITSIFDFLKPEWNGRLASAVPLPTGSTMGNFFAHPDIGEEWVRRYITEAGVDFVADSRLLRDGIVRGKYAFGINLGKAGTDLRGLRDLGLPVDLFEDRVLERDPPLMKERPALSTGSSGNNLAVANGRPHPAAAQLFVNWYASREGQTAVHELSEAGVDPTLRTDVEVVGKAQGLRVESGVKYLFIDGDPVLKEIAAAGDQTAIDLWNETRGR